MAEEAKEVKGLGRGRDKKRDLWEMLLLPVPSSSIKTATNDVSSLN
jgi:hypothetical protein